MNKELLEYYGGKLKIIRDMFNQAIEPLKKEKVIKRNEEVLIIIYWPTNDLSYHNWIEVLKCARVTFKLGSPRIVITLACNEGWMECPRCRRFYSDLYDESGNGFLCERCDRVMHMLDFDEEYKGKK